MKDYRCNCGGRSEFIGPEYKDGLIISMVFFCNNCESFNTIMRGE